MTERTLGISIPSPNAMVDTTILIVLLTSLKFWIILSLVSCVVPWWNISTRLFSSPVSFSLEGSDNPIIYPVAVIYTVTKNYYFFHVYLLILQPFWQPFKFIFKTLCCGIKCKPQVWSTKKILFTMTLKNCICSSCKEYVTFSCLKWRDCNILNNVHHLFLKKWFQIVQLYAIKTCIFLEMLFTLLYLHAWQEGINTCPEVLQQPHRCLWIIQEVYKFLLAYLGL